MSASEIDELRKENQTLALELARLYEEQENVRKENENLSDVFRNVVRPS